jgi:hypothetical protein
MSEVFTSFSTFLKDYAALIGIPIAALVGAVAYQWQKSADRKSALIELRRQSYTAFLDSLFMLMGDKSIDKSTIHYRKLMELSAIASDEVVRKAGDLKMYLAKSPDERIDQDKATQLIAELIITIRKDCFENTDLTLDDIRKIVPFR